MKKTDLVIVAGAVVSALTFAAYMNGHVGQSNSEPPKSVYMLFYVDSKLSSVIGPMSYDMEECEIRKAIVMQDKQDILDVGMDTDTNTEFTEEQRSRLESVRFVCEMHSTPPKPE